MKRAYQAGDFSKAQDELLRYYQHKTTRKFIDQEFDVDLAQADQNANNVFKIKASLYNFGEDIDWGFRNKDKEWNFTLNKMNWFKNFVGVYQRTKDEKYVLAWMNQIESWIRLGDPGFPRTIDTGRRLDNWVISYWMFVHELKSPSVTPEFNARMLLSMAQQAEFLYQPQHWRRYSNWGSFENSGFSKFVIMFPEFKNNEKWLKEIFFRMRVQLENSYHADGMHIEVSPSYHSHELEVWFDFIRLAQINRVETPWAPQILFDPLEDLFLPPARTLMYLYKPTGVLPQVGDTDESDERDFLLEMGKYWQCPDLIFVATEGQDGVPPAHTSVAFPDGGYYVMRSGWGNDQRPFEQELYLLFDCGTNYPWHAHFDMLNIVATAYNYDLLKDPGRFTYNTGEARDYFKSTAAHNTIVIDRQDQPQKYTPPPAEWHSLTGFDYVIGQQNSHPQISHQRSVFFAKPRYWIIVDRLTGQGAHHYDQYWHLSEHVAGRVKLDDGMHRVTAPHLLLYSAMPEANLSLADGWLSYRYRHKVKAPVITCSVDLDSSLIWPTVLYPFEAKAPEVQVERLSIQGNSTSCHAVAMKIASDQGCDFFMEQDNGGNCFEGGNVEADGKVAFLQLAENNQVVGYHLIAGSYLRYAGNTLIQLAGALADVSSTKDRIEIAGDCIQSYKLKALGGKTVFFNGIKSQALQRHGYLTMGG